MRTREQHGELSEETVGSQPAFVALRIPAGEVVLSGDLEIPENAAGLVLFAHGSGSSRFSRRNRAVAEILRNSAIATLLFDLLTPQEEVEDEYTGHLRFDIGLLSRRLATVTQEIADDSRCRDFPLGYFGASTGGAAALRAAGCSWIDNQCSRVTRRKT